MFCKCIITEILEFFGTNHDRVQIDFNIQLTNIQFFYYKDEARVETVKKRSSKFSILQPFKRSSNLDIIVTFQYQIIDKRRNYAQLS